MDDSSSPSLEVDGAPAVHRDDLARDIGRAGEKVYRLGNVLRGADACERRGSDDALALARIELAASMTALLEKAPTLALATEPTRKPNFVIRGLEGLAVELG